MRALLLAATVAAAALLQGCAGALVQDDWHPQPSHPALPDRHIEVPESDLARVCGNYPGMRLHGCAIRVVDARVCIIYTGPTGKYSLTFQQRTLLLQLQATLDKYNNNTGC